MAFKKATGGGPPAPKRPPSQGRLKAFIQRTDEGGPGAQGPSTLPPPPFESETAMEGLGTWLDTHMSLASQLLWVEQQVESGEGPPSSGQREGHLPTIRAFVVGAAAVRDALYELYCDAADPRLATLVQAGAPLETHVRKAYAWCSLVVALLARVTTDLRTPSGPDWNLVKTDFRAAERQYPGTGDEVRAAVDALAIDFKSPVEPLRCLPRDLDALLRASAELEAALATRFG
ncbi:MAG: hypothetical protein ACLP1X_32180 [Polyangiaceae bacterium]|jgi:hypothetical protein